MRNVIKIFTALGLAGVSPATASVAQGGTISYITGMTGGAVIFHSTGPRTAPPSCQASGTDTRWVIDASTLQGQTQLSVFLTAYATNKHIAIYGRGACTIWGDTETVDYLYITD